MSAEPSARPEASTLLRWAAGLYLVLALVGLIWWSGGEPIDAGLILGPTEGSGGLAARVAIDVGLGVGAGLALVALWRLLVVRLPLAAELEVELADLVGPLRRDQAWGLALLSGLAEEIFFRGALLAAWGVLLSSVVFAALHSGRSRASRLWTLLAFLIGLLFAYLTRWRGGLAAPIVAHVVLNGIQLQRLGSAGPNRHLVQ